MSKNLLLLIRYKFFQIVISKKKRQIHYKCITQTKKKERWGGGFIVVRSELFRSIGEISKYEH